MQGNPREHGQYASPGAFMQEIEILAPTFLEYWAIRSLLPALRVHRTGVRLARWPGTRQETGIVVCGLAGALSANLDPGTVLVPRQVCLATGAKLPCDPLLVERLITAARSLRMPLHTGPLLTAPSLITGQARLYWARQGFIAADMETGLLLGQHLRVATVRVVLDNPYYELSSRWLEPGKALFQPHLWPQLCWLGWTAPCYAWQAARVLKAGLSLEPAKISYDATKEKHEYDE
jgi:hypothetical protein